MTWSPSLPIGPWAGACALKRGSMRTVPVNQSAGPRPEDRARSLLAAERSTFWRRQAGRDRYVRHSHLFLDWEAGPEVRSWSGQTGGMR